VLIIFTLLARFVLSSLGDVHRVIGRFLSGLTRYERTAQNSRITGVILISRELGHWNHEFDAFFAFIQE
jgi:hypothetical protein